MDQHMNSIIVHVSYEGEEHELSTYPNEYRSLMQLISDKLDTESFGECLGMGKCGTCLIEIIQSPHPLSYYERNETSTLKKMNYASRNIHLACQIMADENINGLRINILP
ncbi:MAG: ferredoxin [Mucilaginibacter sp.]